MNVNFSATGFWKIENSDSQHNGDLYLNENEGGIFLYIRIPNNGAPKSYLELPLNISFINGSTVNGAKITLVDCSRISTKSRLGTEDVYGYQAKYMLNGVTFEKEENIAFSKMEINIPGIVQWGDVSNYVTPDIGNNDVLIGLKHVKPIKIYSCDEYTLSYYLSHNYPSYDLMKEEVVLKQTPYLIIESESLQSLGWFIDIALQMKRIIEIAMGVPLGFNKMVAESPKINWEFEDGENHVRPIEIIHALKLSDKKGNIRNEGTKLDFLFNLNELSENGNFYKLQEVASMMEPIIELYIDDLYNQEISINRHFLNMAQALETYHSRMICNGTLADYKKRVEKLISTTPDSSKQSWRDFLLGENKNITLRNRIADLILADFEFHFYTGNIKYSEFPKIIADTRNYYTHYNQKQEEKALKENNLVIAYNILRNILEYYLLKELGFEEKFIHKQIRKRIRPLVTSIQIQAADERTKNK